MPTPYTSLLAELKATVQRARVHAIQQVNRSLILMYWELGRQIVESQEEHGWGSGVINRISQDLRLEFPYEKGFSPRNLRNMRNFHLTYKDFANVKQDVAKLPWGHNVLLLNNEFTHEQRLFYIGKSAQYGWTRAVLSHQISAKLYERTKLEPRANNFKKTLPENLIDQANEAIKSSYNLEFLGIEEEVGEQELPEEVKNRLPKPEQLREQFLLEEE